MNNNKLLYRISLLFLLGLFYACSSTSSYSFRTFFFDGVPEPVITKVVAIDSLTIELDSSVQTVASTVSRPSEYIHPPYLNKECAKCHDRGSMGKTKLDVPGLCYGCHESIEGKYETLHGPVAFGQCTQCHDPHKSKVEYLLRQEGQDLCFTCHEETSITGSGVHAQIEIDGCTDCHNPHGGTNRFILKQEACFSCHENSLIQKEFIHGPVDAGKCNVCHLDHKARTPKLLVDQGNALCSKCHTESNNLGLEHHGAKTNEACLNCHNPHSSTEQYLLTTLNPE